MSKISAPGGQIEGEFIEIKPKNQFNWVWLGLELTNFHTQGCLHLSNYPADIKVVA